MTIVLFILILGVIIFIHELGHFLFAKKFGIYVYEFSIGFGPKLYSFKRKNDETEYMIKLIPLGGYVAMAGEEDTSDDKVPNNMKLYNKPVWQRFLVMAAGVINNFILGFVLLFIIGLIYGSVYTTNKLDNIPKDGSLYALGVRDGQIITKINDKKVKNYDDIQTYLALANEKNKNVIVTWNEICEVMSDYFKAKGFVIDNYVVNRFFNDYTTLSDVTTISYIESIQFNLKKINNKRRCL